MMDDLSKRIYFIYKYTFPNGKIYIGQTHDGARRYGRRASYKDMLVGRAMDKYPNFGKEILEYCSSDKVDELEQYYIKLYNSFNKQFGYNLTSGGNSNKVVSEEVRKKLSDYHKGKKLPREVVEKISSPVIQIDSNTLNAINRFSSISEASRITGIDFSTISSVCRRLSSTAGGYYWCFEKDYDDNYVPREIGYHGHIYSDAERKRISKRVRGSGNPMYGVHRPGASNPHAMSVLQYSLKGKYIAKYDCAKTACQILGLMDCYSGVCQCAKGKNKMAGGYIWRYENSKIPVVPYYHRTTKGYKHTDEAKAKMRAFRLGKVGGPSARAVLQYDIEGNFIKEYISCHNAEVSTGVTKVYKACTGEYKTAGGFIWKFKTNNYPKHVKPYKRPGVPVLQYSKDGKFIKEWSSAKKASIELYISASAITACCRKYKNVATAGGYKWEYKKLN